MFPVRLDLFHALNRISRVVKKSHGAFKPFMARLRDACFLVNRDDVQQARCYPWDRYGQFLTSHIPSIFFILNNSASPSERSFLLFPTDRPTA